jgi:hypothetical protein
MQKLRTQKLLLLSISCGVSLFLILLVLLHPIDILERISLGAGEVPSKFLKDVQSSNVFVCVDNHGVDLPDWLQPTSLENTAQRYFEDRHLSILYRNGEQKKPEVHDCRDRFAFIEHGYLNVNLMVSVETSHAILGRFIYRGKELVYVTPSLHLDLSDLKTARHQFDLWNESWQYHNDNQFSKGDHFNVQ